MFLILSICTLVGLLWTFYYELLCTMPFLSMLPTLIAEPYASLIVFVTYILVVIITFKSGREEGNAFSFTNIISYIIFICLAIKKFYVVQSYLATLFEAIKNVA